MHFGYAVCNLIILNCKRDLRFRYLFRFEQIFKCGRVTNSRAPGEVDPKSWEAVQQTGCHSQATG